MGPILSKQSLPGKIRFTVRGQVIKRIERTEETWFGFWAKKYQGILVKLDPEQTELVRKKSVGRASPEDTIEIFMSTERLTSFPEGVAVGVTFAQAGEIEQFFQGRIPLAVVNLIPTSSGLPFENEVRKEGNLLAVA